MSEQQDHTTDGGADEVTAPGSMRRRGLMAAALAGTAAVVVGRPGAAQAATGGPVVLGADNTADNQTIVRNTARFAETSNRAMFVSCEEMAGGRGIEAAGSNAGVSAIGNSSKTPSPSGRAVGLTATTLDTDGYGAFISAGNGLAPLRLFPMGFSGAPTTGRHEAGEMLFDLDGRLFICAASGFPGTWREVAPVTAPPTAGSTLTVLPNPVRVIDTVTGLGGARGPIPAGRTTTFTITGTPAGIPDTATAIVGNLIVSGAARVPVGSTVAVGATAKLAPPTVFFGPASLGGPVANGVLVALAAIGARRGLQVLNGAACDYSLDVTAFHSPA
jgi:hypothetical protein